MVNGFLQKSGNGQLGTFLGSTETFMSQDGSTMAVCGGFYRNHQIRGKIGRSSTMGMVEEGV